MANRLKTVGFEITNFCNLKCKHCFQGPVQCNKNLSIKDIRRIIEMVVPYSPDYFVITGGEPFMHPEIQEIISMLGEDYAQFRFWIASNGTLITPNIVGLLAKYENVSIQISLDGASKSVHNSQHGDSYDKVIEAVDRLLYSINNSRLVLQMTLSKVTYKDCIAVAEYAKSKKIQIKYQFVTLVGNALSNKQLLEMTDSQKTATYLRIKAFGELHPEMGITPPKTLLNCAFEDLKTPISMNIDINGEVVSCTCFDSSFSLGNVFVSSVEQILESPRIKELHERVLYRKKHLQTHQCNGCIVYNHCSQGCIGRAIGLGNELDLDGECGFRKCLLLFNKTIGLISNE